ncbi:MAG: hypothetical protein VXW65_09295 [Pseudomonadota bacterium]|nr:hypothetical protein [Pseudomonadota bacterium]
MAHGTKAEILQIAKNEFLNYYQMLTQEQQQQFKEFPQQLQDVKTTREAQNLTRQIYLLAKQNQQQVAQNGTRNKGRDTGDGQKTVLGDLPKTDEAATATVPELSSESTGGQDANGSTRSGQTSVLTAERESDGVTKPKTKVKVR